MSKPGESDTQGRFGWSSETELVREFARPANVTDAVSATVAEAVDTWPELSDTPSLFEFVDTEKLDGLFGKRATSDGQRLPSADFSFQGCQVTVLYGRTIRVVIQREL